MEGRRFVDELGRRDYVTSHMLEQTGRSAWLLLGDEEAKDFGEGPLAFYSSKAGIAQAVNGCTEAARHMGIDPSVLKETLDEYARAASGQEPDKFGKKVFPHGPMNPDGQIYVMKVTPVIHYTMGGLAIDDRAQVLGKSGEPIPKLLAAGEVTGGLHGANRLAGNSLMDCTVFGRISGQQAVRIISSISSGSDDTRAELR
eukprot:CAMPEP_0177621148 /NCGR_PEP_ID=MMETSP0419_2-20121207/27400_1 /TAXON_ID=582737 /ORGANISM="Tetraselmis sp., Strain GSL018" /LENGTH=199 /DNA_ID=CAMNT_0019120985 /DNA_START=51 /DNA_END=650 /DNA_ORIENTATION=+